MSANGKIKSYTASSMGFGGEVSVTAEVLDGKIISLRATGEKETSDIGGTACGQMAAKIVAAGGIEVDAVSGATATSEAVLDAARQILVRDGALRESGVVRMKPGVYTGSGRGYDRLEPVRVNVTVNETAFTDVDVVIDERNREEYIYLSQGIERMIPRMLSTQNIGVDAITGATASCTGIKAAVRDALEQALEAGGSDKGAVSAFRKPAERSTRVVELRCGVVVAGMGCAGVAAALSAAEAMTEKKLPVSVLALEASGKCGNNSGGSFTVNPPRFCQKYNNGEPYCDAETLYDHWINEFAGGDCKPEIVDLLIENSGPTMDWLHFDHGIEFRPPNIGSAPSTWRCVSLFEWSAIDEPGREYGRRVLRGQERSTIVKKYYDFLVSDYTALGGEYMPETTCTELLYDADKKRAAGVKAVGWDGTTYLIHADAVILAGGGYFGNMDMVEKYLSNDLYPLKSRDWKLWGPYQCRGEMFASAINCGAATYHMDLPPMLHLKAPDGYIDDYPVHFRKNDSPVVRKLDSWSLNDVPKVLSTDKRLMAVGTDGKRCFCESLPFDFFRPGPIWFTVFGSEMLDEIKEKGFPGAPGTYVAGTRVRSCGGVPASVPIPEVYEIMDKAVSGGFAFKADTIEELAEKMGVSPENLAAEVKKYRAFCAAGKDDDFAKKPELLVDNLKKAPFYAIRLRNYPYASMGALSINRDINVLDTDGNVMRGLYACGNDSGGNMYPRANAYPPYAGIAQGWGFTSGRLAGINAVNYIKSL